MATKKCPNGHQYDSSIYGDNCPFCPQSGHTQVNMPGIGAPTAKTEINNNFNGNGTPGATAPTAPYYPGMPDVPGGGGGHTVIRTVGQPGSPNPDGGRKLVGLLVSYSHNPAGEVYKIYEGRNIVGRDHACDISFPMDDKMSGRHLLILYREAEGIMWATMKILQTAPTSMASSLATALNCTPTTSSSSAARSSCSSACLSSK